MAHMVEIPARPAMPTVFCCKVLSVFGAHKHTMAEYLVFMATVVLYMVIFRGIFLIAKLYRKGNLSGKAYSGVACSTITSVFYLCIPNLVVSVVTYFSALDYLPTAVPPFGHWLNIPGLSFDMQVAVECFLLSFVIGISMTVHGYICIHYLSIGTLKFERQLFCKYTRIQLVPLYKSVCAFVPSVSSVTAILVSDRIKYSLMNYGLTQEGTFLVSQNLWHLVYIFIIYQTTFSAAVTYFLFYDSSRFGHYGIYGPAAVRSLLLAPCPIHQLPVGGDKAVSSNGGFSGCPDEEQPQLKQESEKHEPETLKQVNNMV
ncbi:hypothetical protein K402DRAFT_454584 [Aulographum hederae CBS 113979]|uniref:Uncharacterized protein n=1 Tax=Aulographum hederae CBS 113979 TaxID=1176131 RepID=A0A6G1GZA7_9PEZI|nr:hypothetical protein K402DRAFT_454584 [Aulographum hederae CBS 113979]